MATEGFVEPVDGRERPTRGRPAALWRAGPATALHPALLRPEP